MSHSNNQLWVHTIWGTKGRQPFIDKNLEQDLYGFIQARFEELGCRVEIINGLEDHIHCLFLLNRQKSIAEVVKHVKGSSSYYINKNKLTPERFAWQNGYGVYSISLSDVKKATRYIQNQKRNKKK